MAFPAPRRASELARGRDQTRRYLKTAAGLHLQLCKKGVDLCSCLFLLACLLIDPREAGRQDYNSKEMMGRGRLHSYVQGATRPLSGTTFLRPSRALLAYQSLEVFRETLCELRLVFVISQ
jgi:hypothetical protein